MLVRSFRLPGAQVDDASHDLIPRAVVETTNRVLREHGRNVGDRLTAENLEVLHPKIQDLKNRLDLVLQHVDDVGTNEGNKSDHILLGYRASEKAAQLSDDGADLLAKFSPAQQNPSLEKNIDALDFIDEHAIVPSVLECSGLVLRALDQLAEKLSPMLEQPLADKLIHQKNVLDLARQSHVDARTAYQATTRSKIATKEQKDAALEDLGKASDALDDAETAYAKSVAKPEVGAGRAAEVLAGSPISSTRQALADMIIARSNVLRQRSLPVFFDGIFVEQVARQLGGRSEREIEIAERLKKRGASSSEVKQGLKEWRSHAIHGLHGETLRNHVSNTGDQVTQDVNVNIELQATRLADLSNEQTEQIIEQTRRGVFSLAQLQTELHKNLREKITQQANRIIEDSRSNTQELKQLTKQQSNVIVQAVHAEVDRGILAGEYGLNQLRMLTAQDQQVYFREIHQHIDQHLSQTQAMQGALRTMSVNTDRNESFGNRVKRFLGDTFQNGLFKTVGNRIGSGIKRNCEQKFPLPPMNQPRIDYTAAPSRPGNRSLGQRVIQNIAAHELARTIEHGTSEFLHDHGEPDNLLDYMATSIN